jgi:spore coat protein H
MSVAHESLGRVPLPTNGQYSAPSGHGDFINLYPGRRRWTGLPWAGLLCPFGAVQSGFLASSGKCLRLLRTLLTSGVTSLVCILLLGANAHSAEKKKSDLGEEFFKSGQIPSLKIEITGTNLSNLRKDNRKYVRCTIREGEKVYQEVAIRLKGAAGSFRGLDDRPALTVNFDKFVEGQEFHGLQKMHLNNSVQDPSYLTELICGEMFVAAGVPAARTTHARVELNGRDLGLYVLKEGFDKVFLKRHFKSTKGNLYDGGFIREITDDLEKDSGDDVKDHADLKALASAAQIADPAQRMEALRKVLDVERFVKFIAMEVMTWHWDGYAMKRNNYRVYHDLDHDKIVFFPHGMDQMFWEPDGPILPNFDGLVARAITTTTEGRRLYRQQMGEMLTNVFKLEVITNRIAEVQKRIRPVLASISSSAAKNHDGIVRNLRNQIIARAASIERQLNVPEPKPLAFNSANEAKVSGWRVQNEAGGADLSKGNDPEAGEVLKIRVANGGSVASWRTRVLLEGGRYRFQGRARTVGVAAVSDNKGEGAGLRISGSQQPRGNKLKGDTPWTNVAYEFPVPPGAGEVELICELRARRGEAWFDAKSLKLVKIGL